VFALDSSGSIGRQNVQQMTQFLELLINSLNVNANDTDHTVSRIGMLTYADTATIQFQLNTFDTRSEILQAINVQYSGGTTNTAAAIRYNTRVTRLGFSLVLGIYICLLSLSKIRDRVWSYMRHVIWINNQCCPMHQHPGATFMLPVTSTGQQYRSTQRT